MNACYKRPRNSWDDQEMGISDSYMKFLSLQFLPLPSRMLHYGRLIAFDSRQPEQRGNYPPATRGGVGPISCEVKCLQLQDMGHLTMDLYWWTQAGNERLRWTVRDVVGRLISMVPASSGIDLSHLLFVYSQRQGIESDQKKNGYPGKFWWCFTFQDTLEIIRSYFIFSSPEGKLELFCWRCFRPDSALGNNGLPRIKGCILSEF